MKFKYNQILYRNIIIIICVGLILLITFGYFLGWEINSTTFVIYLLIIFSVILLSLITNLVLNLTNKTYIYIDKENIYKIQKNKKIIILENNNVLYTKYLNKIDFIDLLNPITELNCMEITYKQSDSSISYIKIYCSKKVYMKIIKQGFLPKY